MSFVHTHKKQAHTQTHAPTHTRTPTQTHAHTDAHTRALTHARMHTHTRTDARTHARTHTHHSGQQKQFTEEAGGDRKTQTPLRPSDLEIRPCLKQNEAQNARASSDQMYLWWSLCTLYLHTCQVRVTVGDSGLCCTCVTYFEH